jgi:hypothetical protein
MKVLIIGDSFAADWSSKYQDYPGWPELLAGDFHVTNLAQAGVGEYKILCQLQQLPDLDQYEIVIVSHTSPYRVHTLLHPVHARDQLHGNADLIFTDCEYHESRVQHWFNQSLGSAIGYFKYHFDPNYYKTIYKLLRSEINSILKNSHVIVVNNLPENLEFVTEANALDFSQLWKEQPGKINHYSQVGNEKIYNSIKQIILEICRKD